MTDLKFQILKLLYETYPFRELSMMDIFNSISDDKNLIHNALKELKSKEYIKQLTCSNVFQLTDSGADVFEQIQEEREQASKHEKQQSFDNKISKASLLVPFITFILGIVFDHYTDVISFLITFFKKLFH